MKRTMLLLSISVLATLFSSWVNLAEAQQAGKVYRIGWLRSGKGSSVYDAPNLTFQDAIYASFNCILDRLTTLSAVILVPS